MAPYRPLVSRFGGARVLIVEDEGLLAFVLADIVAGLGCEVVGVAASADQAVEAAEVLGPDVVLMDVNLDGPRDGIYAAVAIRQRLDARVIFVTASQDPATTERMLATRPEGILRKPYSSEQIADALEGALSNARPFC
jgi:DNA-binding NarL/FixJ family response regulator